MRNMIKKKYACILLLLLAIGSGCSDWLMYGLGTR